MRERIDILQSGALDGYYPSGPLPDKWTASRARLAVGWFLLCALGLAACRARPVGVPPGASAATAPESAFAALQARGAAAMGVDQYSSSHVFEDLPDGGRIVLRRAVTDSAGVAQIRMHMGHIAGAFAAGDFRLPGFVHDRAVPGTDVMAAKRASITYTADTLPGGGEVRLRASDPEAVAAIHAFLAFQRSDHHAAGHDPEVR